MRCCWWPRRQWRRGCCWRCASAGANWPCCAWRWSRWRCWPGQCLAFRLPAVRRIRLAGLAAAVRHAPAVAATPCPLLPARPERCPCARLLAVAGGAGAGAALPVRPARRTVQRLALAGLGVGPERLPAAGGWRAEPAWPLRDRRSIGCSPLRRWRCCCSAGSGRQPAQRRRCRAAAHLPLANPLELGLLIVLFALYRWATPAWPRSSMAMPARAWGARRWPAPRCSPC